MHAAGGERPEAVRVTGMVPAPEQVIPGELGGAPVDGSGEPWSTMRGTVFRGTWSDMSDERVAGDFEHVMDVDVVAEGERFVGYITATRMVITNAAGTWEGTGSGTGIWTAGQAVHHHVLDYVLDGTGAYTGLRYRYQMEGYDYPWDLTGAIEPGRVTGL